MPTQIKNVIPTLDFLFFSRFLFGLKTTFSIPLWKVGIIKNYSNVTSLIGNIVYFNENCLF